MDFPFSVPLYWGNSISGMGIDVVVKFMNTIIEKNERVNINLESRLRRDQFDQAACVYNPCA
jgi:hypothetical protein